jgi:hypothetical protein
MKKTVTDGRWNKDTCKYETAVEKQTMDYVDRDIYRYEGIIVD